MKFFMYVVFMLIFVFTAIATLYVFLLQAGVFGPPPVSEVPHLGTLIAVTLSEVAAAVILLWKDFFGFRSAPRRMEEINCYSCGDVIAKIDANIPGLRTIGCPRAECEYSTNVRISDQGELYTGRKYKL